MHLVGRARVQHDDRPAAVGRILAPLDEMVQLELCRQLARCRQRQPEGSGDLTHRLLALGADVGEHGHVPASELGFARDELEQLGRGPPAPEAPQDLA